MYISTQTSKQSYYLYDFYNWSCSWTPISADNRKYLNFMFKVNSNCLVIRQSCLGKWQSCLGKYSVSSKFRNLPSLFFLKEPFFLPSKMTSCEEWPRFKWCTVSWLASKEMLVHQFTGCLGKWYTDMFWSFGVIILASKCHCVRKLRASKKAMGIYSSWH